MKRSIALSILLAGITVTGNPGAVVPVAVERGTVNPFAGKSGHGLVETIAHECHPRSIATGRVTYSFRDPASGEVIDVADGRMPSGYSAGEIVPSAWWYASGAEHDTIAGDLCNYIPLPSGVKVAKSARVPGTVTDVTSTLGMWSFGRGPLNGSTVDLYDPPAAFKGRIARAFFYMATVYHGCELTAEGYMMMSEIYPCLTPYAVKLLMQWAREHEPDDDEKAWSEYAGNLQGGYNPFVSYPELAAYIWGDMEGEIFGIEGQPVPLHSTYGMDDRIYLVSPHVPADALWSIDGTRAESDSYAPADLGAGTHHLTYQSPSTGLSGMLMIKIESK